MLNKLILTEEKQNKFIKNSIVFLAPVAIIYLLQVQAHLATGGFKFEYFVPTEATIGAMVLYAINVCIDYFKKLK